MRRQLEIQAVLIEKAKKDRNDTRGETDDALRGAITMFNEQKHYELQSDVHRATSAVEKMRTEAVGLRSKNNDLRDERSNLQRQIEEAEVDNRAALKECDSTI